MTPLTDSEIELLYGRITARSNASPDVHLTVDLVKDLGPAVLIATQHDAGVYELRGWNEPGGCCAQPMWKLTQRIVHAGEGEAPANARKRKNRRPEPGVVAGKNLF